MSKMTMIMLPKMLSSCFVPLKVPCHDLLNAFFPFGVKTLMFVVMKAL